RDVAGLVDLVAELARFGARRSATSFPTPRTPRSPRRRWSSARVLRPRPPACRWVSPELTITDNDRGCEHRVQRHEPESPHVGPGERGHARDSSYRSCLHGPHGAGRSSLASRPARCVATRGRGGATQTPTCAPAGTGGAEVVEAKPIVGSRRSEADQRPP